MKMKELTLALSVAGAQPTLAAITPATLIHGFLKNEAGIPLGPFRGEVVADIAK